MVVNGRGYELPNELPGYTGTVCGMCGFPSATYRYCVADCKDDGTGDIDSGAPAMSRTATPHQHRVCERCKYEWLEETMAVTFTKEMVGEGM